MIITITICIVVFAFFGIITTLYLNKFQFTNIKINEAANSIDTLLEKKGDLLNKVALIVTKELELDNFLEYLGDLGKLNNFELNDLLSRAYNELFKVINDNDSLLENEDFISILENLNNNEIELVASIKFYNDSVVILNQLTSGFPSSIIGFFGRYKKKDFFNNEKRKKRELLTEN